LSDFIEYFGDRAIDAADIEAIFHVVDSDRSQYVVVVVAASVHLLRLSCV